MGHLSSDSRRDMMESYFREHPQEAREMVVRHLGGNLDQFRKKHVGPKKVELPADFVSYDNTLEVGWNRRYGELVRYREDHGHIRAPASEALGKWMCAQRSRRRGLPTPLSPAWEKRIELVSAGLLGRGDCRRPAPCIVVVSSHRCTGECSWMLLVFLGITRQGRRGHG